MKDLTTGIRRRSLLQLAAASVVTPRPASAAVISGEAGAAYSSAAAWIKAERRLKAYYAAEYHAAVTQVLFAAFIETIPLVETKEAHG